MSLKSIIQIVIILLIIIILCGVYYNYFANNIKIALEKNIQNEINKNNTGEATDGNNKLKCDIKKQGVAWMTSNKKEKIMVKVMKKGSRIMVTGYNEKGSQTIDHYSLLGFTKAYNTAKKACS